MKKYIVSLIAGLFLSSTYSQPQYIGSYSLYSYDSKNHLVQQDIKQIKSIASITKLFTAITILESGVDLDEKIKVNGKSNGKIPSQVLMSRKDLLRAMLISSDNRAAESLANNHPGGFDQFIIAVNQYATNHLLYNTHLTDSTGLLSTNTSTAYDLIEFLYIINDNPIIRSIAAERVAVLNLAKGKKSIKINLHNTNPDLFVYDNILISKTGFTNAAGRCLLMLVEKTNEKFAVVILGQPNVKTRSKLVNTLLHIETEAEPILNITSSIAYY
jgi:D-alanyl-D-alanine endopeptidase (penicillin-binding protein 7)